MSIRLESVSKTYTLGTTQVHALNNMSLDIHDGELTVLTGPSGSGKSTALHLLGALDKPSTGEVFIDNKPISGLSDKALARIRREKIGFVFQSFNLIPVLSVFANVEFPMILTGAPKEERTERVAYLLKRVGLEDRARHKTEELSGGQRQRVAIARALVNSPSVVLSDEPTANLDSKTSNEILDLMEELNRDQQVTFVFGTHDPSIVARANRIVTINDGQIVDDMILKN